MTNSFRTALLSAAALVALTAASHAALSYTVTLNVSSLSGNTNAPFALDVQMATGSGNVSNSVTLSNFQVTGGSFTGTSASAGGTTGTFNDTVTLNNSSGFSFFAWNFSTGTTQISFTVNQTTNSEFVGTGTAIPDQFSVFIDDGNTIDGYVPTTDPSGGNSLVTSTISSGQTVSSIATYGSTSPDGGVTATVTPVPEAASSTLLGLGVVGFLVRRRRA